MAEVRSTKGEDFFEEAPVVKENNEALDKVAVAPASEPVIVRKTNKSPVILGVIILSVVLAVIIALVCIGFATKNQGEMELLYEEVQGGIAITGVKSCGAEVVIPSEINGKPVVKIGERAFSECTSLTSIVIPNSVTTIGDRAFAWCSSLTSVTIPNSVTSIGDHAFDLCSGLTSVTIPNSVTTIGDNAFTYCDSLTSVVIPESVTTIGAYAFEECEGLTSIVIPDSVKSIGWCAFHHCNSLEEITVPFVGDGSDNTHFGYIFGALNYVLNYEYVPTSIKKVTVLGGEIGYSAFRDCTNLTSVTLGDSVTTIDNCAFTNCKSLTNVTLGDSVTTIGYSAFEDCDSLKSVIIGKNVTTIGEEAFAGCKGLARVDISDIGAWCNISFNSYYANPLYLAKNLYINGELVTHLVIPNGVTTIGEYTFINCKNLTSVTIPNSVDTIGYSAFEECAGLTSVTLGDRVTTIDNGAFLNCYNLKSIVIPDSITAIGDSAFYGCKSLTSIVIPNGVKSISNGAFMECSSLTGITIPNSVTTIGGHAFRGCIGLTSVAIGNSVTTIGNHAFDGCYSLTSVEIPNGVTSIDDSAFYGCTELTNIAIPNSVTTIGDAAFYDCNSLTSVTIGDSVTTIGGFVFYGCEVLTSVIVDENNPSYKSIDGSLYTKDGKTLVQYAVGKNDISLTIPNGVTTINNGALEGCSSLTSVMIPNSVTTIGYSAFGGCEGLTKVDVDTISAWCNISFEDEYSNPLYYAKNLYLNGELVTDLIIPSRVTTIGNYTFRNCTSLTRVEIPNNVTTIGYSAFEGCEGLEEMTVPFVGDGRFETHFGYIFGAFSYSNNGGCVPTSLKKVTVLGGKIGYDAFYGCGSLTNVTLGDSVTTIGGYAFEGCENLISIEISNSVTSIGDSAFDGCKSLARVDISDISAWCNISFGDYSANPLYHTKKLYLNGELVTDLVIPSGVITIGKYAFYGYCYNLTSVTIPNSVTTIGGRAFEGCISLTRVDISDIGAWCNITFENEYANPLCCAENLYLDGELVTDLVIPSGVTKIGDYAFCNCENITSITIPSSVTTIGDNAFTYCDSLTIYCEAEGQLGGWSEYWNSLNCPVVWDCKNNDIANDGKIYFVDDGVRYSIYEGKATVVKQGGNVVTADIKEKISYKGNDYVVTTIGKYAFEGCESLTNVTLGDSVTTIGASAFRNCIGLTSITIPNSVTTIGVYAFKGCYSLTRVTIPISVTLVGNLAFDGCTNLTIYCEATSEPSNWDYYWNNSNCPVVWGYKES